MDPSIMKLLEDDEDETMHSGVDVEAFQAALNRDIGGDVSASQFPGSDAVLSQGSNNTSSQSSSQWPTSNHDNQSDGQNQEPKTAQEQHSSEMEPKQHGSLGEHLQHVASQDVNNIHLSQKQSQDDSHQAPAVQVPLHNSQTIGIHNSGKDSVLNKEVVKSHNPSSESQYAKLQQMSNQQATVSEQPSSQVNRSNKQVPFGLLLPILLPQLAKDRAMQLQTLFTKLKKDEIPKDSFVRLMKGIVGDQMLRQALAKVQMQPQARPNQASAGQQLPVRMPTVSSGARQLNDPHALAQMHQRSMNVAVDQSRMSSSAGQTMDSNARKSQEFDVKIESQGLQPNQLTSSNSNSIGQETERASVHIQGLNKQQQHHLHFASAYGNSGGNYNPYSGTTSSSTSSIKPQSHDSHMNQIPHQSIGSNHLGGSTHGLSVIGMPKLEQQTSFNDPKRLPGGSVSSAVNNTASQQTSNAWQPSTNKEQNLGLMSSVSYVKKEPGDLSTEQQNRHNLSKLHGYSSVNSAQLEQSGASQGALKDEFSRGLPASTNMPPTTSTGLLPHSSASASAVNHLDSSVLLSSQIPSNASGIAARPSLKKSAATQKKPLEALGSSPPPSSKKQKTSGGYAEQSIEQLNDVTAVSGVDLREEEEQLFSGPKEDSRVSEASRKAVQEEEERLILQKAPLQKKLIDIMAKCGLKGMSNDVEKCLSLSVEERMRGLISNLIRLSKQRVDFEKTRHRTVVTSDVRQQIMTINRKVREEWEKKQAEAEKLRKLNDVDGNTGGDGDKDKDDGRSKSTKVNKEEDDKMRTNAANVAARAAYGGDDMLSKWQLMAEQAKQKREGGVDVSSGSQPAKDVNRKSSSTSERSTKDNQEGEKRGSTPFLASSVARKLGKSHAVAPQTRVARSISVKDVIAVLEREPQMSKSPLIHRLYEKIHSEAPVEQG
ncbi:transcription initiation factor TFIID subunit 4b-like [Vigna unguiculata]|uniref:transcription initiation factor TFIID subunit 4b-like n=1 Tax=Vigna unguiculata TaxID=3917 RepID=UPI001015DCFB|nr:transcription initiation factor TFIID subunit 4b-like [Vigna unguiculata]